MGFFMKPSLSRSQVTLQLGKLPTSRQYGWRSYVTKYIWHKSTRMEEILNSCCNVKMFNNFHVTKMVEVSLPSQDKPVSVSPKMLTPPIYIYLYLAYSSNCIKRQPPGNQLTGSLHFFPQLVQCSPCQAGPGH